MKLDISAHSWLTDKATLRVFNALGKGNARFVGGCVRNAILGAPVADLDVASPLEPKEVTALLRAQNIAVHATGLAHGTVTAVANNVAFEITTLRKDVATNGRHADVEFTKDWVEDARRRDFTMNALYADLEGNIYDPTGQGIDDIKAVKLRFVGEAEERIREDYLRILRYFRFHAWYGQDKAMDKQALDACRELKSGMKQLSCERVWMELKKLLSAPSPHRTVNVMLLNGVLEKLLPEASNSEGLQSIIEVEKMAGLDVDPYLRLMAMSARDEFAMAGLINRLKMSNAEKTRLLGWAGDMSALDVGLPDKDLKIEIYKAGSQVAMDRAILRAAGADDPIIRNSWIGIYETARDWERPIFPVTGKDLVAAGVQTGPKMGKVMEALKTLWIRSGFTADKERLLAALVLLNR